MMVMIMSRVVMDVGYLVGIVMPHVTIAVVMVVMVVMSWGIDTSIWTIIILALVIGVGYTRVVFLKVFAENLYTRARKDAEDISLMIVKFIRSWANELQKVLTQEVVDPC